MDGEAELGNVREPVMRRLVALGLAVWIGRWLALEIAAYLGRRLPPRLAPIDSPRPPGWMPRRADSLNG